MDLRPGVVMGILNITADSFYAGSRVTDTSQIIDRAGDMLEQGAIFLDLGGASTGLGAALTSAAEEAARVLPAIEALRHAFPAALISIDTYHAYVAEQAVAAGACLINDVSAGRLDAEMFSTAARLGVPYVLMHHRGIPAGRATEQAPYIGGLLPDILSYFAKALSELRTLGAKDVIVDPGFGFGKTMAQNWELLLRLPELRIAGCPIIIGLSRKRMIYELLNVEPEGALPGTIMANMVARQAGAHIFRVHDVGPAVQMLKMTNYLNEAV